MIHVNTAELPRAISLAAWLFLPEFLAENLVIDKGGDERAKNTNQR
jgi:hypothetical protein